MDQQERKLEQYITAHIDAEDDVLKELNRETHVKILHPRMLAGHLQGVILKMFCKMLNPQYILEIGTYTGYTAICMAMAMKQEGEVHTIEINDELSDISEKYFKKSGYKQNIKQYTGDARQVIKQLNYTYDLIFIDGDKKQYTDYYLLAIEKVRKGGMIIADNVLWNNKVINEHEHDKETEGIRRFNNTVKNDQRVEKVILPVRDGIMLIRVNE